ncbi:hypothetical protein F4824DRAFT_386000 [Ustulina deusta]|nr:hypothetical protein F4824DRAFT_386000 [Ustulina deusta]
MACNDSGGCDPPHGVTVLPSCPASWIGCAVELGGGCCRSGQVCGSGVCYNTTPKTFPVSETKTTTDSRGQTTITVVTSMTVITDGPMTSSGSPTAVGVPQLVPSTVAKLPDALQSSDSGGGGHSGLSSGALGGIVTGVIVVFVAVVVAATFIVMRLKKAERAARDAEKAAESKHGSSNSPTRSHKSGCGQTTFSEIDSTTDADPSQFSIMVPSPNLRSRSATIGTFDGSPSRTPNFTHSDTSSPPLRSMPFNYPPSEASDDNAPVRRSRGVSVDSQGTYNSHTRKPSDLSELEEFHGKSELGVPENNEAGPQRRSDSVTQPAKAQGRRNSDLSGQNRARGDSNAGALGTVNEIPDLHGHYGPAHTAAGQTAASLTRGPSSINPTPPHQDA